MSYGPLPVWARAGFHPADVAMPYVLGAHGEIVAVLWARHDPLYSPPKPGRTNKILWVSRSSSEHVRQPRDHGAPPRRRHRGWPGSWTDGHWRSGALRHRHAAGRLLAVHPALVGSSGQRRPCLYGEPRLMSALAEFGLRHKPKPARLRYVSAGS